MASAGDEFTCATGIATGLICWGRNQFLQLGSRDGGSVAFPPAAPSSPTVTALGWTHGCRVFEAPDAGGPRLVCWGDDSSGKLGLPPGAGPRLPTLIQP
ncbi:MAG: hypothetical protein SFW67_09985 [Myxococcaceae bacterium]|nr:hypothetical protein [Myxococcaceae bacterium]